MGEQWENRDCHGFVNPCGSQVWVGTGVGKGWEFVPLKNLYLWARVDGFVTGLYVPLSHGDVMFKFQLDQQPQEW